MYCGAASGQEMRAHTVTTSESAVMPEGTGSVGSLMGRSMCSSGRSGVPPRDTDSRPLCTWAQQESRADPRRRKLRKSSLIGSSSGQVGKSVLNSGFASGAVSCCNVSLGTRRTCGEKPGMWCKKQLFDIHADATAIMTTSRTQGQSRVQMRRSMVAVSRSRHERSAEPTVSKCRVSAALPSPVHRAAADASVACPHSGTSLAGVNQRSTNRLHRLKPSPAHG